MGATYQKTQISVAVNATADIKTYAKMCLFKITFGANIGVFFANTGYVTMLGSAGGDIATTDTASKVCILADGTGSFTIKNNTGTSKNITIWYF